MSEDEALWQVVQLGEEIMSVQAYAGTPQTQGRAFVLLLDVQDIFPNAERLQCGSRAISFMADNRGHRIYPLRVQHQPEIVMEVVQATADQYQTRYVSRPIVLEQQEECLYQYKEELELQKQPPPLPRKSGQRQRQLSHHEQQQQQQQQQEPQQPESSFSFHVQQSRQPSRRVQPPQSVVSDEIRSKYRKSVYLYESFLEHIQAGQVEHANAIRDDFRGHFESLEIAMAQNRALQEQMLGMQHTMIDLQQQSLDRLAVIQSRVQAILVQNYELHEYPTPRLFVILPSESTHLPTTPTSPTSPTSPISPSSLSAGSSSSRRWDNPVTHLLQKKFRLYFLCECGEHTRSGHSRLQHHIHLACHEGYDIEQPNEFLRCYGSYVLRLLQMLKYGVAVAGLAVLAMTPRRNSLRSIDSRRSASTPNSMEQRVNHAIEYLEEFAAEEQSRRQRNSGENQGHHENEVHTDALEGADLKRLSSFLKQRDRGRVLGGLYRIVTPEGYVKWVCLDHYREISNTSTVQELGDVVEVNGGSFDEHLGNIEISLSSAATAALFYRALEVTRAVQELKLTLLWEANAADLKVLRDAVHRSSIVSIELTFTASSSTGSILRRRKRADPLWQMIMNAKIQSFTVSKYPGFFRRSAMDVGLTELRILRVSESMDWKKDGAKLVELVRNSPRLTEIFISCADVNGAYTSISRAASGSSLLRTISITASKANSLLVTFKQDKAQTIHSTRLVVPKLAVTDNSLLQTSSSISSLHVCERSVVYRNCDPLLKLLSRNPNLSELKLGCYVAEFSSLFETFWKYVDSDASCQLKQLCLYRDNNCLSSTDLRDPTATSLELMSLNVNERVLTQLLRVYGTSLTKLTIDSSHWKPIHSSTLEEATRFHPKVHPQRLTHLYQRCADVDDGVLDKLNIVINRSRHSLVEYELVIDKQFMTDPQSSKRWVSFIRIVGERLTKFGMNCSDPNEWIHALRGVDFPAMETISFKNEQKVELINYKRVLTAVSGIGYVNNNVEEDQSQGWESPRINEAITALAMY
ncbi:hypothetical protein BGZ67_005824 [Mortierella alpina]|nr:hypothetical protein BGZ67_005824 [Mortierella alpina]